MSKILVTGPTGKVGSRLIRELLSRGQEVRAFTRSGERSRFDSRVEITVGDFNDKKSILRALEGVSQMYLLSAGPDLEVHETNAIEAAHAAGIELIVKQSVARAHNKSTGILRRHRAGEERIERSGLPYVFLRPDSFTTNALSWAETIKASNTAYGALGDAAIPVIDPDDIAAVAAAVFTVPGHAGRTYELTGPESLTSEQQVATLATLLGRPLKYVNVQDHVARDNMLRTGMQPRQVEALLGLTQTLRAAGRMEPTEDVRNVLGREPRSFQQWAEANLAAFQAAPTQQHDTAAG
ncbi:MAG TPA: NAD(P)H-binding protein [Terriglobia bacterium]|nr:NAD(P)H-binding protein [Terriglobia bacterium]